MKRRCSECGKVAQPAVNYKRNGKTYYRKVCNECSRAHKVSREKPRQLLKRSGYKIKGTCDRCGFKSKTPQQMKLVYLDSNPSNVSISNLRTYCLNCEAEMRYAPKAKTGLVADY